MTIMIDCDRRPAGPQTRRPVTPQARRGPHPARPRTAAPVYRGSGVAVSRAPHARRPIGAAATAAVALLAALITVWLGVLAQSRATAAETTDVPSQLAVVQVRSGESLQRLAARIAPDAPVGHVVDRIRELNDLDTAAVEPGRTLIAPVGAGTVE